MEVHSLTFSHIPRNMKCVSWASLLARTFVSSCIGREPKVRVATLSQDYSSLVCECNWTCFNLVQTKKWNMLIILPNPYHVVLCWTCLSWFPIFVVYFFTNLCNRLGFFTNENISVCASQLQDGWRHASRRIFEKVTLLTLPRFPFC